MRSICGYDYRMQHKKKGLCINKYIEKQVLFDLLFLQIKKPNE